MWWLIHVSILISTSMVGEGKLLCANVFRHYPSPNAVIHTGLRLSERTSK